METESVTKFWMCCNINSQSNLTKRYETKAEAIKEANRLARHHMGNTIVVLEVVDCYRAVPPIAEQLQVVGCEVMP